MDLGKSEFVATVDEKLTKEVSRGPHFSPILKMSLSDGKNNEK